MAMATKDTPAKPAAKPAATAAAKAAAEEQPSDEERAAAEAREAYLRAWPLDAEETR